MRLRRISFISRKKNVINKQEEGDDCVNNLEKDNPNISTKCGG